MTMRKTILLTAICLTFGATAAFGQSWKFISENRDGSAKWFYQTARETSDGDMEVWLKIVLTNPQAFMVKAGIGARGRKLLTGLHHELQFTIFHCGEGRMSTEKSTLYRTDGSVIISDSFFTRRDREPIEPGSVDEGLLKFFCRE